MEFKDLAAIPLDNRFDKFLERYRQKLKTDFCLRRKELKI